MKKLLLLVAVLSLAFQASVAASNRPTCSSTLCHGQIQPCICGPDSVQPGAPANCTNWINTCKSIV